MDALSLPRRIAAVLAVTALAAACSSGAAAGPTSPAQPSSAAGGSGSITVNVAQAANLGAYLTGADGKSLYLLTKDSVGTSTCTGACATTWPPFVLQAGQTVVAGSGVMGTLSTIKRADGSDQVAVNGLPLYYFSGDTASGQTNGEGFKGIWFIASPSGTTVGSGAGSPEASPSATKKSGGGYGY